MNVNSNSSLIGTGYRREPDCQTTAGFDSSGTATIFGVMSQDSDKAAIHALVSGLVQGVFFRMFVLREATALGLTGEVRNLPDGRVEVTAEGERAALTQLISRLHTGPRGAAVSAVEVEWSSPTGAYRNFTIAYD